MQEHMFCITGHRHSGWVLAGTASSLSAAASPTSSGRPSWWRYGSPPPKPGTCSRSRRNDGGLAGAGVHRGRRRGRTSRQLAPGAPGSHPARSALRDGRSRLRQRRGGMPSHLPGKADQQRSQIRTHAPHTRSRVRTSLLTVAQRPCCPVYQKYYRTIQDRPRRSDMTVTGTRQAEPRPLQDLTGKTAFVTGGGQQDRVRHCASAVQAPVLAATTRARS
jgi:hypothetical protein